jgi:hypothetical protein
MRDVLDRECVVSEELYGPPPGVASDDGEAIAEAS